MFGDIPSPSFGYSKQWHCTNYSEFLSLINSKFPLPHQRSWQGFRLSFVLSTKMISDLGTKTSRMGEWKQLRRIGKSFGGSGVPIVNPSELTHNRRNLIYKPKTRVATGFAGCVWKGSHSRGKQVQVGIVRAALGGVNVKIALYTGRQPIHQPGSNEKYILPLQLLLKGFEKKTLHE